jgi:hypothetical protein
LKGIGNWGIKRMRQRRKTARPKELQNPKLQN